MQLIYDLNNMIINYLLNIKRESNIDKLYKQAIDHSNE